MANKNPRDNVVGRGKVESTPLGTGLFIGLRAADALLQRSVLLAGPLTTLASKLGTTLSAPQPAGGPVNLSTGLTPFQTIIWSFSIGSAAKQILWVGISNEPMYVPSAIGISLFNTINNTLNTLIFTVAASNPTWSPSFLYAGAVLYSAGLLTETIAELQRKRFKSRPENKGKVYSGGLWSTARHINYFGYTLWRGGYALAAGGLVWGGVVVTFFAADFLRRGIPVLDSYMMQKYGEQWEKVKKQVPYSFAPGLV